MNKRKLSVQTWGDKCLHVRKNNDVENNNQMATIQPNTLDNHAGRRTLFQ